jgi:hypothetical protein
VIKAVLVLEGLRDSEKDFLKLLKIIGAIRRLNMLKKMLILTILIAVPMVLGTAFAADSSTMVGTLSAMLDDNGNVTAMFVGYSQGDPVIIGPATWASTKDEFSNSTTEDIANKLCGHDQKIKKITKSTKSNKELVATVVLSGQKESIVVGR